MELMSSLLLCALVAYFPQALGDDNETNDDDDIRYNSRIYHQKSPRKKILLNLNGPPLVNMISDLQYVFMDVRCKKCIDCMERAIKAYKRHTEIVKKRPAVRELQEEILTHKYLVKNRLKRETPEDSFKKTKKTKRKTNKSVSVTKYNVDGEVYALKVKENNVQYDKDTENNHTAACNIYSVKKAYECDTPESESFLLSAKRKVNNRKNKKDKDKSTSSTTSKPQFVTPSYKKRHVDLIGIDMPENFDTSIEDMTY